MVFISHGDCEEEAVALGEKLTHRMSLPDRTMGSMASWKVPGLMAAVVPRAPSHWGYDSLFCGACQRGGRGKIGRPLLRLGKNMV